MHTVLELSRRFWVFDIAVAINVRYDDAGGIVVARKA